MNRRNYHKELEKITAALEEEGKVPSLLLHSCCAPCSSYCIEYLSQFFHVTVFYYNPNIYPDEEYAHRVVEQQAFIRKFPARYPVSFVEGDFEKDRFYEVAKGLEKEPERGARCTQCFHLRLGKTAQKAAELGMDFFTTTLTISPMKDAALLNEIGEQEATLHKVRWLPSDFKKNNGYLRSCQLSEEYGIYRQDYCGCVFSMRERQEQKAAKAKEKEKN
ncbi:MAG: epoxyqueuosine reductase QueH [Lachnospiraceae bacterium]|nr:epoxyqueuosine reductase QueH [Lachnospiraceae bacterium]